MYFLNTDYMYLSTPKVDSFTSDGFFLLRLCRSPNTAAALVVPTQHQQKRLMSSNFAETYFKMRGYNQFGLYEDDILAPTATVEKAVTRLPDELQVK